MALLNSSEINLIKNYHNFLIKNKNFGWNAPSSFCDKRDGYLNKIINSLVKKNFKYLNGGRHRETLLTPSKNSVIKIPSIYDGIYANISERNIFSYFHGSNNHYAPCRLIDNFMLLMKKVETNINRNNLPQWAYNIDAVQVGRLPNGKLVAFDYSDN